MIKRKIYILFILTITFNVISCATFSKKNIRKELDILHENNISKLSGDYSFSPIKRYYSLDENYPNDNIPDSLKYNNVYQFLVEEDFTDTIVIDTIRKIENKYHLNLSLLEKKKLRLKIYKHSKVIKDTVLLGKYKNGMFYLDNKYLKCHGIPYLFGGCNNRKRRIGLTKSGNLLINKALSNEGALLLFFGVGYSYNLSYEYKRQ